MNLTSIIVVVLRLLALNFILRVAVQGTTMVLQSTAFLDMNRSPEVWLVLAPWLYMIALAACAVVFWIYAGSIARLVTKGESQQASLGALTLVDCYAIAFTVVGLIYMAANLAVILNWFHFYMMAGAERGTSLRPPVNHYQLAGPLITFVTGFLLLVKARKWSLALARRHAADDPKAGMPGEREEIPTVNTQDG